MQADLNNIVNDINRRKQLFGFPFLNMHNSAHRQEIADELNILMSPENVHCDGEISLSEANKRWNSYVRAAKALLFIDPSLEIYEL